MILDDFTYQQKHLNNLFQDHISSHMETIRWQTRHRSFGGLSFDDNAGRYRFQFMEHVGLLNVTMNIADGLRRSEHAYGKGPLFCAYRAGKEWSSVHERHKHFERNR